ncbi:MAG TPA: hypothetical protein VMQ99_25005 [Acetobacteraceae bacterium]|jgi:hypothetical protein|nr:hypothetical protein [Acetobacteraceae bacterium]
MAFRAIQAGMVAYRAHGADQADANCAHPGVDKAFAFLARHLDT